MEETKENQNSQPPVTVNRQVKEEHPKVVVERDWKEYLGESLLIIFSVALALIVTEILTSLHEKQKTKEVLGQLREELIGNKKAEEEQYQYHLLVLKNIDSAIHNPPFAQKFINNGEIDISNTIAPDGVLRHDLNDVAWQVAKQNNIFSKIDLEIYSLLTDIYNNQDRITKSEGEIARVLLSWESRKPENLRTTLILVRDNYHGWAVDRAPQLLKLYQQAIDRLGHLSL